MQGFWLLWSSCFTSALGHALAVVRPYASRTEVQSLEGSFLSWDTFLPCNATPNVPIDLILVYSQAFDDNADALTPGSDECTALLRAQRASLASVLPIGFHSRSQSDCCRGCL
ncbi:unnamed protein product [Effrenium voratum]|nr:unnamed protein product [Effrenium voratum]